VDRNYGCDGTFRYVRCKKCGLVYMNPQISPDDIAQFYPEDYGPHQNERRHSGVSPRKLMKDHRLSALVESLDSDKRLLDVGCGNGRFLYQINLRTKCKAYGLDISAMAAKSAKQSYGLDIFTGTACESPFEEGSFDVITAWSYLEHVHDPSEELSAIYRLLKTGGTFVINIPDFDSFSRRIFVDKWYHLDCPRHLYIYNPATIKALMAKSGFEIERILRRRTSKGLLGSLQYYFYGNNYNLEYRNRIRSSSLIKTSASFASRIEALFRKTDVMIVVAEKV
jgi:SAM-dependent methyltransferase